MPTGDGRDLERKLGPMGGTITGNHLLLGSGLVLPLGTAARTDTIAPKGAVHAYISGATIIIQCFDQAAGAWRSVTLS